MTRMESLQQVLAEQRKQEGYMAFRNPWVPLFYNYVMAITILVMAVSFVWWGLDIHTRHRADALTEAALADYKAEQQAAVDAENLRKEAEAKSLEAIIKAEAEDCAKAAYGVRLFDDKYVYEDADFWTYYRSAFNRADATGKSLHEVLSQEGQYLGYSENNVVLEKYRKVAEEAVREWHSESSKPCDLSYQFAELTPSGIWLKNDLNANGYARRWRAQ